MTERRINSKCSGAFFFAKATEDEIYPEERYKSYFIFASV